MASIVAGVIGPYLNFYVNSPFIVSRFRDGSLFNKEMAFHYSGYVGAFLFSIIASAVFRKWAAQELSRLIED